MYQLQKGKGLKTIVEIDADHAHDLETRRYFTGILLYLNGTLQSQYSKRQDTVEISTNGSELVAARIEVEIIIEFQYKFRMLGVLIIGMSLLYGAKMIVIPDTLIPGSYIEKKHCACTYHFIRKV